MMYAEDVELREWTYCLFQQYPLQSGSFLKAVGEAAVRADSDNYAILRPALLELKKKYPQYEVMKP